MMQDQAIVGQQAIGTEAETGKAPLPLRSDTILGVCEALGEDFGFNPTLLRVALAAGLLWNPAAIVGGYLAVGLVIALARFLFPPVRKIAAAVQAPEEATAVEAPLYEKQEERELIAA